MINAARGTQTRVHGLLSLLALTLPCLGCQTPLDRQQLELVKSWGQANDAFIVAIKTYQIIFTCCRFANGVHPVVLCARQVALCTCR